MREVISMRVIYWSPRDYPQQCVVRKFFIIPNGSIPLPYVVAFRDILTARRAMVAQGLSCLPRERGDDPCIVETWI